VAFRTRSDEPEFNAAVWGTIEEVAGTRVNNARMTGSGKFFAKGLSIAGSETGSSPKIPGHFPGLAAKKVLIASLGIASGGHNDIGPVPAGKKWLFLGFQWSNGSGGSVTVYVEFKDAGGTYFRASPDVTLGTGSPGVTYNLASTTGGPLLLYAGESLSINATTTAGGYVYGGELWEFDDTSPLERAYMAVIPNRTATYTPLGTLLTVPAGKTAEIGVLPINGVITNQGVCMINQTAAARTFQMHRVPAAGAAGAGNVIQGFASATAVGTSLSKNIGGQLTAGESIQISSDVAAGPALCVYSLK